MPVYRKNKKGDAWRVVIYHNGERRDWVVSGNKSDAERYEARKRVELEAGDLKKELRSVPTFAEFCEKEYTSYALLNLKERVAKNRGYQMESLGKQLGGHRLTDIGTKDVEHYKSIRVRQGIRPGTINDDLKVLTAILNYARSLGYPVNKPSFKNLPMRGKRRNAEAWTTEEVNRLMLHFANMEAWLLPMVVFILNTGCRRGEALALEWVNVDLKRKLVRIWASEDWQPKDGDNREVPVNDALLPWLKDTRGSSKWVFPNEDGGRYAFWPTRRFDRARKAAGLTGGPHKLRHTFATHFLASTPDLFLLGRVMGHSHQRVTELYGHLLPDSLARAARAVSFPSPVKPGDL